MMEADLYLKLSAKNYDYDYVSSIVIVSKYLAGKHKCLPDHN